MKDYRMFCGGTNSKATTEHVAARRPASESEPHPLMPANERGRRLAKAFRAKHRKFGAPHEAQ
jgi:hypothetical protein